LQPTGKQEAQRTGWWELSFLQQKTCLLNCAYRCFLIAPPLLRQPYTPLALSGDTIMMTGRETFSPDIMQKGCELSSQPLSRSPNLQNLQTYIYISRLLIEINKKGCGKSHNPLSLILLILLYSIKKFMSTVFSIFF
jgi:hypothetical protein